MDLSVRTVSFDGQGLKLDTSDQAEIICNELRGKNVEVLILQGNTFGIEAAELVGLELAKQPELIEAHFKDLFTTRGPQEVPDALRHLLKGISDSGAQLKLLDLSDNAIGPIGAPSVIEFLESSSADTIEKLYINNCGLGPEGSTSISSTIPRLKNLKEFVCGRNRLENKGATNMSRALSEIRNLEVLKINQNGIQVEGIIKIAEVLKINTDTLRHVDLSDNWIKTDGARALSVFIERATKLEKLCCSDAYLMNEGFEIICEALSRCPALRNIDEVIFEGNELHGQGIVDLIETTFSSRCGSSFTLNLLDNDFGKADLVRLESLSDRFKIYVDEIEDDYDYDGDGDHNKENDSDENESDVSNGYVDLSNVESEFREVTREFIEESKRTPQNDRNLKSAFLQLISSGLRPTHGQENFHVYQILSEELGLMKSEETRKKKPLSRDAIVYIGKNINDFELPSTFIDFFRVIVKNNDDLGCGKILFEKLDI